MKASETYELNLSERIALHENEKTSGRLYALYEEYFNEQHIATPNIITKIAPVALEIGVSATLAQARHIQHTTHYAVIYAVEMGDRKEKYRVDANIVEPNDIASVFNYLLVVTEAQLYEEYGRYDGPKETPMFPLEEAQASAYEGEGK